LAAQVSPSTLQLPPPSERQVPLQSAVQHCALEVHAAPTSRHAVAEHLPLTHEFEQHCEELVQLSFAAEQKLLAVQTEFSQAPPEQQSLPLVHGSPAFVHEPVPPPLPPPPSLGEVFWH